MSHYPLQDDHLYSNGDFEPEIIYNQKIEDLLSPYHIAIHPFIGEKGQPTSIRFILLSNKIDSADTDITRPLIADNRAGLYFLEKYLLDLDNDILLVKDFLGYWDMLYQDEYDTFIFLSIHTKSLELAKKRALQLFFQCEGYN